MLTAAYGNQLLKVAQWLGLAKPTLYQNWLTVEDIASLLSLADCEVIKQSQEILLPLPIPFLARPVQPVSGQTLAFQTLGLDQLYRRQTPA